MDSMHSTADTMEAFLRELSALRQPPVSDPSSMKAFLDKLHALQADEDTAPVEVVVAPPQADLASLQRLFSVLSPLLLTSARQGAGINVWDIAGVGRKETANAQVLRWFLDPEGSHGLGAAPLNAWLAAMLGDRPPEFFPNPLPGRFSVATETYPLANENNRVDIEIDGHEFLLILEIKVDALEGPEQMRRYIDLAEAKTGGLVPYLIVFLSPAAPRSLSSGMSERVVLMTWATCARAFRALVYGTPVNERGMGDELLLQFATHIENFRK